MIRFSAGEEELASLLRFLRRRAPGLRLMSAPLAGSALPSVPVSPTRRIDRRPRKTARPLLQRLASEDSAAYWGIYTTADETAGVRFGEEETCVMIFQFGPSEGPERRREVLFEARDEIAGDPPDLTPRAVIARTLVERSARRLRRRGDLDKGRWFLPVD